MHCRYGLQKTLTISKTDSCLTFWMLSRPCAFWIDYTQACRCQAAYSQSMAHALLTAGMAGRHLDKPQTDSTCQASLPCMHVHPVKVQVPELQACHPTSLTIC